MTTYLSYRYTGIPKIEFESTVVPLVQYLRSINIDVFCNLEREDIYIRDKWSVKQIMQDCFDALDKCNFHITYVSPNGSTGEGMLIELGYAIKIGLPTLLLMPSNYRGVSARAVVDTVIEYSSMDNLCEQLANFFSKKN